jgi:hypothetical protein
LLPRHSATADCVVFIVFCSWLGVLVESFRLVRAVARPC